jgi:type IV pilus assembly protein PilF
MTRGLGIFLLGLALVACNSAEVREREETHAKLVDIHTQLAKGHLVRNQPEFALQEVSKALQINPDASEANAIMALVQVRLRNDEQADAYFRKAVEVDPKNGEAQNNYGAFLCERGRAREALKHFDAAIANALYRDPEKSQINAGICLKNHPVTGVSAAKYFRGALGTNPRSTVALYNLAVISLESGEPLAARGFLQRYFEVAPDSPESLLLAVKVEHALGARDAQAGYALRLRGKFPQSEEAKQLSKITGK